MLCLCVESEYDPLESNLHALKTSTSVLKDPTHVSSQKANDENSMLGSNAGPTTSSTGKKLSKTKTKDMLAVELWASGKIEGAFVL